MHLPGTSRATWDTQSWASPAKTTAPTSAATTKETSWRQPTAAASPTGCPQRPSTSLRRYLCWVGLHFENVMSCDESIWSAFTKLACCIYMQHDALNSLIQRVNMQQDSCRHQSTPDVHIPHPGKTTPGSSTSSTSGAAQGLGVSEDEVTANIQRGTNNFLTQVLLLATLLLSQGSAWLHAHLCGSVVQATCAGWLCTEANA